MNLRAGLFVVSVEFADNNFHHPMMHSRVCVCVCVCVCVHFSPPKTKKQQHKENSKTFSSFFSRSRKVRREGRTSSDISNVCFSQTQTQSDLVQRSVDHGPAVLTIEGVM